MKKTITKHAFTVTVDISGEARVKVYAQSEEEAIGLVNDGFSLQDYCSHFEPEMDGGEIESVDSTDWEVCESAIDEDEDDTEEEETTVYRLHLDMAGVPDGAVIDFATESARAQALALLKKAQAIDDGGVIYSIYHALDDGEEE